SLAALLAIGAKRRGSALRVRSRLVARSRSRLIRRRGFFTGRRSRRRLITRSRISSRGRLLVRRRGRGRFFGRRGRGRFLSHRRHRRHHKARRHSGHHHNLTHGYSFAGGEGAKRAPPRRRPAIPRRPRERQRAPFARVPRRRDERIHLHGKAFYRLKQGGWISWQSNAQPIATTRAVFTPPLNARRLPTWRASSAGSAKRAA